MRLKTSFITPVFVLILYVMTALSGLIDFDAITSTENSYLVAVIMQLLILVLPGVFFCRLKGTGYVSKMNFRLFTPGKLGFILIAAVSAIGLSMIIRMIQILALGASEFNFSVLNLFYPAESAVFTDTLYVTVTFALLPAICGEFIFRGIVLSEYCEGGYGAVCSSLISAAMFAMLHFSLGQFPVFFAVGLILSAVTLITQSIVASMITHFLFNLYIVFGEKYLLTLISSPESLSLLIFLMVTVTLLALLLTLGEAERIYHGYAVNGRDLPTYMKGRTKLPPGQGKRFGEALTSPTFLLSLLFFVVMALSSI